MKYYLTLSFTLLMSIVYSQQSIFLKEKDTLYIIFDNPESNKNIVKHYKNTPKKTGVNTIFFLMDSILAEKRNKYYKIRKERSEQGGGTIGASSTCDWCFGLYFVHNSISTSEINQSPKLDPIYINFKKSHLEKENVSLKDSMEFDKLVYKMIYYRYYPPVSSSQIAKEELNERQVFYFDGSTKKYNELKELLKEPHHLFMLDKTWYNPGFNNLPKGKYYIFNEVRYRNSYKLVPD
ncbi:hypothetical protein [Xanthomarina spongicola]|jgi:hypothetical protein|uniref:Uncharacterized protein n=1 Tax=Xanthomarina spongicola TaxID=570520 RepID=A0A316DMX4_9FLAO|nr:hypothetical protein [Xanthomarina spongicola]PWK18922.1 hypothetical protein LX78_01396 [Xanthomarina spongicola]